MSPALAKMEPTHISPNEFADSMQSLTYVIII